MKRLILVMMCVLLYAMPVNATELNEEATSEAAFEETAEEESSSTVAEEVVETIEEQPQETVVETSEQLQEETSVAETIVEETVEEAPVVEETLEEAPDAMNSVSEQIIIPEVVGMTEEEALEALAEVVLPDGSSVEVIKNYMYARDAQKDTVFEQTPVGAVSVEEAKLVTISISLGVDPRETDTSAYLDPLDQTIVSKFGIDWESIPASYEYNWDNSENCWYNGVFIDGVCYKTPVNEYNTNVRHKVQLYTDGEFVYFHIVFSRDYEAKGNGSDYRFFIDGEMAAFQAEISMDPNVQIPFNTLSPGTHQLYLTHRDSKMSYRQVIGGEAYYTAFDSDVNAHLEMKIPLEEMKAQNENIDLENIGTIEVFNPNLMYRRAAFAGASTFPFATAAAALILVPGTALVINKKRKTVKKDSNE